jgi:hypothetical protein
MPFMATSIIGTKHVDNTKCLEYLRGLGISVTTMTQWDYGLGYVGLESLATSCLTIAKNSMYAPYSKSEIVNVMNPMELIQVAKYFKDNPDEYQKTRRKQYNWGTTHFTYEAIANRFKHIILDATKNGWLQSGRLEKASEIAIQSQIAKNPAFLSQQQTSRRVRPRYLGGK